MEMVRLIYQSKVVGSPDWSVVKSIVLESVQNNAQHDITGLLIMTGEYYLQVLEGPAVEVNRLYAKIVMDERHTDCQIISYTPIQRRAFDGWAMNCINTDILPAESRKRLVQKFGEVNGAIPIPTCPELAFALLFDVYPRSEE